MFTNNQKMKLSAIEWIFIERKRKGWSQEKAALKHKLSVTTLSRMERGHLEHPGTPGTYQLTMAEACVILRRRAAKTQKWLAEQLGLCRYYVNQMEAGKFDCSQLLEFWAKKNKKTKR